MSSAFAYCTTCKQGNHPHLLQYGLLERLKHKNGTAAVLQKQKQSSRLKFSSYAAISGSTLCLLRGLGLVLVEALALEEPPRVPLAALLR